MNYTKISDKIVNNIKEKILLKNTDGTLGINDCGVESSGLDDANYLNETIDCETRKNLVYYKQESQPSLVIEKFKNKMR